MSTAAINSWSAPLERSLNLPFDQLSKLRLIEHWGHKSSSQHLTFEELGQKLQVKLRRAGTRGRLRPDWEAAIMLDRVPPSYRTSIARVERWLQMKDASHIQSFALGGTDTPENLLWEHRSLNRRRGKLNMSRAERFHLSLKWHEQNLTRAALDGVEAAPMGAAIAVAATLPASFIRYSFSVANGDMTALEAIHLTAEDAIQNGTLGLLTTAALVAISTACPPVSAALTAASPALVGVGIVGILEEYYQLIYENREQLIEIQTEQGERISQLSDWIEHDLQEIATQLPKLNVESQTLALQSKSAELGSLVQEKIQGLIDLADNLSSFEVGGKVITSRRSMAKLILGRLQ